MTSNNQVNQISRAKYIRIAQYPEKWGRHNNGGDYAFYQHYSRTNKGENFSVQYGTSSEFDYCHVYGSFQSCDRCQGFEGGKCIAEFNQKSEEELNKIIALNNGKNDEVKIEYF